TETTSGTGSAARNGRSCSRKPPRPLFGSPIELTSPLGVSHRRGGGLPARGASVIVFDTNTSNGNAPSRASPKVRCAAIGSKVPDPFQTAPKRNRVTPQPPAPSSQLPTPNSQLPPAVRNR